MGSLAAAVQSCSSAGATSGTSGPGSSGGSGGSGGSGDSGDSGAAKSGGDSDSNSSGGTGASGGSAGFAASSGSSGRAGISGHAGSGAGDGFGGTTAHAGETQGGAGGEREEPEDPCTSAPCENGGRCRSSGAEFSCECRAGFDGERCATNIDDCSPDACVNGECVDGVESYVCACARGFTGVRCELPRFAGLTPLQQYSEATAVSGDGRVVVGNRAPFPRAPMQPFRWTVADEFEELESTEPIDGGFAYDVNEDGSVIVGNAFLPGGVHGAFRWTSAGGLTLLGTGGIEARAVSANGNAVVGTMIVGQDDQQSSVVFRWTPGSSIQDLGTFPDGSAFPLGFSNNGTVIVGRASTALQGDIAFRWQASDGFQRIALDSSSSTARAISGDGTLIAGDYVDAQSTRRPFLWRQHTGAMPIPVGALTSAEPRAVNRDGTVIVGTSSEGAWIYDGEGEARLLLEVLAELGADVSSWNRVSPTGISSDGSVIVGIGDDGRASGIQGWIARLGSD